MGWGRVKTPRNINLFADFHVSVPAEPAAAGEPAEGWKSSVFRNTLERPEDSFRFPESRGTLQSVTKHTTFSTLGGLPGGRGLRRAGGGLKK